MNSGDGSCQFVLVGGGARSGKSAFALEQAVMLGSKRVFLATAEARDSEMDERIRKHRLERGDQFRTIEVPLDLPEAIEQLNNCDVLLIDCLTLWVSNLMEAAHNSAPNSIDIEQRMRQLVSAIRRRTFHIVLVSNEVGMGIVPMHASSRRFRDLVGTLHGDLANAADQVHFAVFGCVLNLKPGFAPPPPTGPSQEADGSPGLCE